MCVHLWLDAYGFVACVFVWAGAKTCKQMPSTECQIITDQERPPRAQITVYLNVCWCTAMFLFVIFFFMWHINKHAYRNIRLLYVGLCLHEEILCMNEVGRAAEETDRGPDRVRQTVRQRGVTSHSCCKCSVFHCQ